VEVALTTRHDDDGITRREFGTRLGAAAGIAIGSELFGARVNAAPHVGGRILGANDRVVTASIGIRGKATRSSAGSRDSRTSRSRRSATSTPTWRRSASTTRAWRT